MFYEVFLPAEENVSTEPAVVATGENLQDSPLSVAHHVELGQGDLGRIYNVKINFSFTVRSSCYSYSRLR